VEGRDDVLKVEVQQEIFEAVNRAPVLSLGLGFLL
jgi:hypothetical protein